MKRTGGLWEELTSFANLLAASQAAAAGKRARPDVAKFLLNLEPELIGLRRQLIKGAYRPGAYRSFTIYEPKQRVISAASFRDRVVHHALTRMLEPVFERCFSAHSYACRRGLGTHRALAHARQATHRHPFVLKCDVRKYFASIDHRILRELLERKIKCRQTLRLAAAIIAGSNAQEPLNAYFPGDDLFTPYERRRGLPLGNQTSQFFANIYLNPLDQFVERELKPVAYARYVDDFLIFGDDKGSLLQAGERIRGFLMGLRLSLHHNKTKVYPCREGVSFLGWRLFPCYARLQRDNVARFRQRLRRLQHDYAGNRQSLPQIRERIQAWMAHADGGDTWRLRRSILAKAIFCRRCAV